MANAQLRLLQFTQDHRFIGFFIGLFAGILLLVGFLSWKTNNLINTLLSILGTFLIGFPSQSYRGGVSLSFME